MFADIERRLVDFDDLRLGAMDSAGIEMSVLSLTTPGIQGEKDRATAVRLARLANEFLAREVQKRPLRYGGFAAVPLQDPQAAADELQRAVKDLKFRGALINGQTNGHYLDDSRFLPFWERVQELDVPVYLHPGDLSPDDVRRPSRARRTGLSLDCGHRRPRVAPHLLRPLQTSSAA